MTLLLDRCLTKYLHSCTEKDNQCYSSYTMLISIRLVKKHVANYNYNISVGVINILLFWTHYFIFGGVKSLCKIKPCEVYFTHCL